MKYSLKELIIFSNQEQVEEKDPNRKEKFQDIVECLMLMQASVDIVGILKKGTSAPHP